MGDKSELIEVVQLTHCYASFRQYNQCKFYNLSFL